MPLGSRVAATLTKRYHWGVSAGQKPKVMPASREALMEMIAAVQGRERKRHHCLMIGLPAPLDQLACGMLHEWCGDASCSGEARWAAPMLLLSHLVRRCERGLVVWIGKKVWPQPWLLAQRADEAADERASGGLLERSVLVDPPNGDDRLWAIDVCLRSSAVGVVIADASGMTMAHSRRLQLAAEAGDALALLARPGRELAVASAAAMRWRVEPLISPTLQPRWQIELIRCKAGQGLSGKDAATSLVLEHDGATGDLRVPAALADRPSTSSVVQEQGEGGARSTSSTRRAG